MKRQREEDNYDHSGDVAAAVAACSYQSPLRPGPQRSASNSMAPSFFMAPAPQQHITPVKRQRDRTVPMDAMSRLMTAATSAARMKKRAQMTLTSLFSSSASSAAPPLASSSTVMGCCAACPPVSQQQQQQQQQQKRLIPTSQLHHCAHCERTMGPCCTQECSRCTSLFCSNCSTINCDEQFDRVFCLSCHYDISR